MVQDITPVGNLTDRHHAFSALAQQYGFLIPLEAAVRTLVPATVAEEHALLDLVHVFIAARLPDVADQLVADGHLGRLIDDQSDLTEVQR